MRTWLLVLLVTLAAGCTAERVVILTIVPPEGAELLSIAVVRGDCPSQDDLRSGEFRCNRTLLHTDTVANGAAPAPLPSFQERHSIVVVASTPGCELSFACVRQDEPTDLRIDRFETVPDCGSQRACAPENDLCELRECAPPSGATVAGGQDADGDEIPNWFECCGQDCAAMASGPIPVEMCQDADRDGTPNYLDTDSDGEGPEPALADRSECGSFGSASEFLASCDYQRNGVADVFEFNDPADYDGDGLSDALECEAPDSGEPGCPDSDADGYVDARDLDSDDDGSPDRDECPSPPECPDGNGDGVPAWRDRTESSPSECGSDGFPAERATDAFGSFCSQTGFDFVSVGSIVEWLGPAETLPTMIEDWNPLSSIIPPAEAWNCGPKDCAEGSADRAAVLQIREDDRVIGFIVDARTENAVDRFLPPELAASPITPRVGRYAYSVEGEMVTSL